VPDLLAWGHLLPTRFWHEGPLCQTGMVPLPGGSGYGLRVTGDSATRTLTLDCGGTWLKAAVVDLSGQLLAERVRVRVPYPCPPDLFVRTIAELVAAVPSYDRVSVGFPGMVRGGRVLQTPHYVTEAGPFSPRLPDLAAAWADFDVRAALSEALDRPTRLVNDAELVGFAVTEGKGFEVVLTLGTGLGAALFDEGRLLPKIELSQAPFVRGQTFDQRLGNHERRRLGNARWTKRVAKALDSLWPVLCWDRLYLGGGNAQRLVGDVGHDPTIVTNEAGLLGGVRLWERS
jgi:polyphosphate glucokinase